ncbi:MAG: DUF5376 family protein [Phaeodactylibacter sp.]|nr:DUF5376 family protein [Phaeodactylibacter sp.]
MAKFNDDTQVLFSENVGDYVLEYLKYKNTLLINTTISSNGKGHYLSDFLSEFNDTDDIHEDLLSILDDVLDMNLLNEVISAESLSAYVEKENTYFIDEDDLVSGKQKASENPEMFIPTSIFKEIILKWLEFLESQGS